MMDSLSENPAYDISAGFFNV